MNAFARLLPGGVNARDSQGPLASTRAVVGRAYGGAFKSLRRSGGPAVQAPPIAGVPTFRANRPDDQVSVVLRAFQIRASSDPLFVPFDPVTQAALTVASQTPNIIVSDGVSIFDPGGRKVASGGAAVPVKLGVLAQPTSTLPGQTITPAVQVAIQDGNGVTVNSSQPVTLVIGSNPSGGTLSGTLTKNAVNGIATFADLKISKAGDGYTLVASSPGVSGTTSSAFSIVNATCVTPPSGLVAWWPGDTTADDIKGDNGGFAFEGVTFTAGKVGPAFTLNGVNGYVSIFDDPTSSTLRPATLTADFWFKSNVALPSTTIPEAPLVVKLNPQDDARFNSKGYDFFYEFGTLRFGLRRSNGVRIIAQFPDGLTIPAGEWHHVAGTFDGRYQRLYYDAALVDTVDWLSHEYGTPTYVTPANILIGRARNSAFGTGSEPPAVDYFFNGQIDEVELFNRALSLAEIQSIFNAPDGKCKVADGDILVADTVGGEGPPALLRFGSTGEFIGRMVMDRSGQIIAAVVSPTGDIYAVDPSFTRIVKITPTGTATTVFSGSPLMNPVAIGLNADGNIIVGDNQVDKLFKITPAGVISEFLTLPGPSPNLQDIAIKADGLGNLIVAYDSFNTTNLTPAAVLRVAADGTFTTVASGDGAPFSVGGLAVNAAGNYIIADFTNHRIVQVTPAGAFSELVAPNDALCCNLLGPVIGGDGNFVSVLNFNRRLLNISPAGAITVLHDGRPLTFPQYVLIYRRP
jgi:hypothetical protein